MKKRYIKYISLLVAGTLFSLSQNLYAQDSSYVKWRIRYSASVSYDISPVSIQGEYFIKNFAIYLGPRLFDQFNGESPFYPEGQTFKQRIGLAAGAEYYVMSIEKKICPFGFYNFHYNYKIGHEDFYPSDPNNLPKSDNYYFEHTIGLGLCINFSKKINLSFGYAVGNLRIKKHFKGDIYFKDYFSNLIMLSVGYNFLKK